MMPFERSVVYWRDMIFQLCTASLQRQTVLNFN